MKKYKVKYKKCVMIDACSCREYDREIMVEGIIYETDSSICYKVNEFKNITLFKARNLCTNEMYLYR